MNNPITIASLQMFVHKEQKKNLLEAEKQLIHINKLFPQINMVVFPELSLIDLTLDMHEQAEEIPGNLTMSFSTLAKRYGVWLIPGSIYERSGDDIFNTTPVFSPQGDLVGKYRKRYPWCPYEQTKPGKEPFVFSIEGVGAIGIMICYDLWFPEVARDLTSIGAELIVVPTMTTTGDRYQEQVIARAAAITQQCYIVSCNGVGFGGVGGSMIIDPEGFVLQESGEGAYMQTAVIDFERVRYLRKSGIAGVSTPIKAFKENPQLFQAYKK